MKVLGISGSPRKEGNTSTLVRQVLSGAASEGADIEFVELSALKFRGCNGCEQCATSYRCVVQDDMQRLYDLLDNADGLVLGSPTYFYNVTALAKTFIDRLYCYDTFDPTNRSVWASKFEKMGIKYAVTVAVCEQNNEADMGYTSVLLEKPLQAVGYRVVENLKVLHLFEKNEASKQVDVMERAELAGRRLVRTIKL